MPDLLTSRYTIPTVHWTLKTPNGNSDAALNKYEIMILENNSLEKNSEFHFHHSHSGSKVEFGLKASGSYHRGPKPAAFLATTLKGGFNGPLKCFLTIA